MEHGPIIRERLSSARVLEGGIRFFLAGALTASQITGGYAPFALGLVAAAGPGALRPLCGYQRSASDPSGAHRHLQALLPHRPRPGHGPELRPGALYRPDHRLGPPGPHLGGERRAGQHVFCGTAPVNLPFSFVYKRKRKRKRKNFVRENSFRSCGSC